MKDRTGFSPAGRAGFGACTVVLLLAVGVGCASTPDAGAAGPRPREGQEGGVPSVALWTGGSQAFTALVENDDIIGATMSLHRASSGSGTSFQGSAFDRSVNVSFDGSSAHGIVGNEPLNLDVSDGPNGVIRIRGIVGGASTSLDIGANRLSGYVGRCIYDMARHDMAFRFEGVRNCSGGTHRARLEVTKPILDWAPIETATLLSLVLRH